MAGNAKQCQSSPKCSSGRRSWQWVNYCRAILSAQSWPDHAITIVRASSAAVERPVLTGSRHHHCPGQQRRMSGAGRRWFSLYPDPRLGPWTLLARYLFFLSTELRSCVKVEVAVLGSPSLTVRTVSEDVKLRNCVKVEVVVLGSPSLILVLMVSVDVKQHWTWIFSTKCPHKQNFIPASVKYLSIPKMKSSLQNLASRFGLAVWR